MNIIRIKSLPMMPTLDHSGGHCHYTIGNLEPLHIPILRHLSGLIDPGALRGQDAAGYSGRSMTVERYATKTGQNGMLYLTW